jgi:hypothetical protein
MKRLTASIVVGPLLLIGPLPAVAGQPIIAVTSSQLAASGDATADRDTYTQKARVDIQEWQHKLHEFSASAEANGKEASNTAASDLDNAWSKAEAASWKLQDAGAESWENAKAAYEKASRDLADAWDKVQHGDK